MARSGPVVIARPEGPKQSPAWSNDRLQGALAAVSHALHNIAPLYLMCDPNDLGRVYEIRSPHTGHPTIYLYERAPGGVGLAERLFRLHDELVTAAIDLVRNCGCEWGCPSCVGPVLEVGSTGKADCLAILSSVIASPEMSSPSSRDRSEEHTSELQSRLHLVCRLLLEKKKKKLPQHQGKLLDQRQPTRT